MKKILFTPLLLLGISLSGCSNHPLQNAQGNVANSLDISIFNGTAFSQKLNAAQTYQAINFQIADGTCNKYSVSLTNNETISLKSCYQRGVLLLDTENPKGRKIKNPIAIYETPIWQQGFIYNNISTNGAVHFTSANVKIKIH